MAAQAAQAGKIALGPVKIRPTGQQNLTTGKTFQKLSCGPVDLAVQREDWLVPMFLNIINWHQQGTSNQIYCLQFTGFFIY